MKIHFIIHEPYEGPGAFIGWANHHQYQYTSTKVYKNERMPENLDEIDFLIILGGPQQPDTKKMSGCYFDSKEEIKFISKCIENKKLIFGVCLGAQLIGEALGASFESSPNTEIGIYTIALTNAGKQHELFSDFPRQVKIAHWHNDMPGLTDDSKVIAFSEGCPRQIIEYSPTIYGFQCHFEFLPESIARLVEASKEELRVCKGNKYVQSPDMMLKHDYAEMNKLLFTFLDKFTQRHASA